jgi:hypothetical protein
VPLHTMGSTAGTAVVGDAVVAGIVVVGATVVVPTCGTHVAAPEPGSGGWQICSLGQSALSSGFVLQIC